jgi:hypothetical protein
MYAEYINGRVYIFDSYNHKTTIKEMNGRKWNPEIKAWILPCNKENLVLLKSNGCKLDKKLDLELKRLSLNNVKVGLKDPIEKMPIKVIPYSHQVAAYNMVCSTMDIFERG